jgi:hypothetical protein
MMYLDYFLYTLLIILLCILIDKKYNNQKEGFSLVDPFVFITSFLPADFSAAAWFNSEDGVNTDEDEQEIAERNSNTTPDDKMVTTTKLTYGVAKQLAYALIKMPWKILNSFVKMITNLLESLQQMIKPLMEFAKQMLTMIQTIIQQMYAQFMTFVQQGFSFLRNLPAFIQEILTQSINMFAQVVNRMMEMVNKMADVLNDVVQKMMALPMQVFGLVEQMSTVMVNMISMMLKLPENMLNMVIGLQNKIAELMNKPIKIPFSDQFFG